MQRTTMHIIHHATRQASHHGRAAAAVGRSRLWLAALITTLGVVASADARLATAMTSPRRAAAADSTDKYVGKWAGSYTSDHAPSGDVLLEVTKSTEGKIVVSMMQLSMQGEMNRVPTASTAATAEQITWKAEMMGMSCDGTAIVKADALHGTLICGHGSINFVLKHP